MSTDVATRPEGGEVAAGTGGALALRSGQTSWTPEQEAALVQLGLGEAPDADRLVFLHVAQRSGLDPFARQIYMIGRWDKDLGAKRWTIQTGIDGFRAKAEEHPQYAGQMPIQWCGEDGVWVDVWLDKKRKPTAARAQVLRHDRAHPTQATCLFDEFAQTKSGGGYTSMWDTKSAWMIGKCAEAGALRAAFPQTFSGLVTDDEAHGLDRQAQRTRVPSERVQQGPVEVDELTGQKPAQTPPAASSRPSTEPRKPDLPGGSERMTTAHQKRLFAGLRAADSLGDSKDWASSVLDTNVRTWASLTADQANILIGKLEAGDLSTTSAFEVVDAPTAPPANEDDVEEAYAQIESDRDEAAGGDA